MRSTLFLALTLSASAFAGPAPKKAPGPHPMGDSTPAGAGPTGKATQCGVKVFPLAVGNSWTYSMIPAPMPADDSLKRIIPRQPSTVIVTVKAIDGGQKGADTVATLEEKTSTDIGTDPKKPVLDEHTYTTTITCNAKKFDISPDSFFFAGEPGGMMGMKLDKLDRKNTSWVLTNGGIGEAQWREDIVAMWTRVPHEGSDAKLGSGKIEMERQFTPQPQESVSTKAGTYTAEKLGLITTGRVTLDNAPADEKPLELPANFITTIWIAPGAGVIQTLNPYAHMYQLSAATLK